MHATLVEGKAQLLPLARTLTAKEALPASARAQALLLLGGLGDKSDLKLCEALFSSAVVVTQESFDKKQPEILAADVHARLVAVEVIHLIVARFVAHAADFGARC